MAGGSVLVGALLQACGGGAGSGTSPTTPSTTAPAASGVPLNAAPAGLTSAASPVAASPQPSVAAGGAATGGAAWNTIVAAAKQEGTVVVLGPAGDQTQSALVNGFQQTYPDITVGFTAIAGSEVAPKVLAEVSAGQHITDLVLTGTTTILDGLVPANAVVPLPPLLVGPNVQDPSVWSGGSFNYADDSAQYDLMFSSRVQIPFVYNRNQVQQSDFTAWKDLLDPRWKGQIVALDPTHAGAGQDAAVFCYIQPTLGPDFLRALFTQQDTLVLTDANQILDMIGQGARSIGIGPDGVVAYQLQSKGVPLELFPGEALQEGDYVVASNATVAVVSGAPHPHAVEVYLDYLLSPPGQLAWSQASGLTSLRTDVPHDFLPPAVVPKEGVNYLQMSRQQYQEPALRNEVSAFVQSLLTG